MFKKHWKELKITFKSGHYQITDNNGDFICSTDSYIEALQEIEEITKAVA
jgi:hypothetical protein